MWPERIRCATCLTFDLDAESVWLADDPENAHRPVTLSQGKFGPRVALPWILDLLARHTVKATFFVPGIVVEGYPEAVRAIADNGHELAVHGYTHTSPAGLSRSEEVDAISKAQQAFENAGLSPVGYRAPSWELSPHSLDLLAEHGFQYSSNMMDSIYPYRHPGNRLIELPVHWALDDAAHFSFDSENWERVIVAPSAVREIWEGEFEGYLDFGGVFVLTLHPQIIGRPHRLRLLEKFIQFVQLQAGVWIATCAEVAIYAAGSLP